MADDLYDGPDRVTVEFYSRQNTLTLPDLKKLQKGLAEYLKKSDLGDRDALVKLTDKTPAWIDPDGRVRLGGWVLEVRDQRPVLVCRINQNDDRALGYAVPLTPGPDGGLQPDTVLAEKIRFRR